MRSAAGDEARWRRADGRHGRDGDHDDRRRAGPRRRRSSTCAIPARGSGPDGKPAVSRRAPIWADVPDEKWNDWRWQLSNRVNDLERDRARSSTSPTTSARACPRPDKFRVDVTPYFISLIDPDDPNDPIRRQIIPVGRELRAFTGMMEDSPRRGSPLAGAGPRPPLPGPGPDADHDPVRELLPLLHAEPDRRRPGPELQPPRARGAARLHPPDAADPRRADLRRRRPDARAEAARVA